MPLAQKVICFQHVTANPPIRVQWWTGLATLLATSRHVLVANLLAESAAECRNFQLQLLHQRDPPPAPHQRQRRHQGRVITSSQQPPRQHVMTSLDITLSAPTTKTGFNMAMENGESEDVYIPYCQWGFSS